MRIKLPAALSQSGTPGTVELEVPAQATLRSLLENLNEQVPGSTRKILSESGSLYGYVNLYVNGNDVRHGEGLSTPVRETDEVIILPAVSGG